MSVMRVSVIIPVLNEAELVSRAIDSARDAEEIICADGGSSDGSPRIIAECGAQLVAAQRGRGRQLNAAAAAANGDVLLFLHADNWLADDAIAQIRFACRDARQALGGFEQQIEARGAIYRALERGNAARVRLFGLLYGDQGLWIRRELFHRLSGFAPMPLMEDVDLSQRARRVARPRLLPGPIYISPRRWQQHGVVRQTLRNWALLSAYHCGAPPERLAGYYPPDGGA
ncbi:MAG: TIGR04283 family arsenosugar biosynthesis glycosyltransferase [Pirellulales bacterium]